MIDVRAPIEYLQGTLPGAVNLPIMNNVERAAVGTAYKKYGREEALKLGHSLVSGDIKLARVAAWKAHIEKYPESILFCFRGGLRSKITQQWLKEDGLKCSLIEGGYKAGRRFLNEVLEEYSLQSSFLILSGPTGSAKTRVLKKLAPRYPTVDLEGAACHRGSAFGSMAMPQPSQIDFENTVAQLFLRVKDKFKDKAILLEDESRLIGRCALPESLFLSLRRSAVIFLEESFEQRVENIFQDYISETAIGTAETNSALLQFETYRNSVKMISRKLGGARSQEILADIDSCEQDYRRGYENIESNRVWIRKLLAYYYDPAYGQSFKKRNPKILVRGNADVATQYLLSLKG